ncbi:MAG: hypothetical protein NXH70_02615 [Hyphomonas sp.]|nr:hypothetical protein [Hyphomonas sp.]
MLQRLDFHAVQAGSRYVDFLNTLRLFTTSAMRRDPTDARVKATMKRTAVDRARSFKQDELEIFEFAMEDIIREARDLLTEDVQATGGLLDLPQSVVAYVDELSAFYDTEITSQIQRDVSQAAHKLSEFALEVFMVRQQPFESHQGAHIKALIDTNEQLRFFFRDRTGRRHASQKFVRGMFRQTLLMAALHTYSVEAMMAGADHLEVTHPEDKADVAGMKIGFRRDQDLPVIADLKDEVFHPNSRAFVKAVF